MKLLYLPNQYSQQRQREKKVWIYPYVLAAEATYYEKLGHEVDWGQAQGVYDRIITEPEGIPFFLLPSPDRNLTNAMDRIYQANGNFKYHPGTYIQSAGGCWHGKCVFCIEQAKKWLVRPLASVLEEVEECKRLGFKEVFDDSATLPIGDWLQGFCKWAPKEMHYGCNMRICDVDFVMMKRAGFRMLLFGIESANQSTLDRIQKGIKADDIIPVLKKATEAGIEAHIAFMSGYPWESEKEEANTFRLVHRLLCKGYARTAQVSTYRVPGEKSINRNPQNRLFRVARNPEFWYRQVSYIKNIHDLKYLFRSIREGIKCLNVSR